MLAAIGFLVLAVILGIYAWTSALSYTIVPARERLLFASAYGMLSITTVVWAAAALSVDDATTGLVFMSDIMLTVATGCMLAVLFAQLLKPLYFGLMTLTGAGVLALRAFVVPPSAYTDGGLLHFNLAQTEALLIGGVFLIVWLPATLKVINLALQTKYGLAFRGPVSYIAISVVLMTSYFLAARRPIMIILSFIGIAILFAILAGINILIARKLVPARKRRA